MANKLPMRNRMKVERQPMANQDPKVRARNFNEVPLGYTAAQAVLEAQRCLECKNAPCVGGCPVNVKIPEFLSLIVEERFIEAAEKIKETNGLPAVCGRVCPQEDQCEKVCLVGKKGKPVAIGNLERFVADYERMNSTPKVPPPAKRTGKRVAVVGGGPSGLTVAGDLIRMGHAVTLFEALHKAGGVLVYGIPEFRLPKAIVSAEIDFLSKLGVDIQLDSVIGKCETIDELLGEYDAVFVGTGAGLPYFMGMPGENLNGVYSANEFLTRVNLMKAYNFPEAATPVLQGKRFATVGGGNTAMDSSRTPLRLGAEKSYIVYRRSMKEMPARIEEVHHAEEEGVDFQILTNPVRVIGNDKGFVSGLECLKMELGEPDASGRRKPVPIEGSEFVLAVDVVTIAIGNGPNPLIPHTTPDLELNKKGNIVAKNTKTSKKGVFAGGDIVLGAATVILAMGEGRMAANQIDEYLATGAW